MTMIIGAVGNTFAALASDRLLSVRTGLNTYKPVEQGACKLICVSGTSSIAYTGPAYLDGKRTDYWLVDTLTKANASNLLTATDAIADAAGAAVRKYPIGARHLTIAACGFERFKDVAHPVPVVAIVSNHYAGKMSYSKNTSFDLIRHRKAFPNITKPFVFYAGQKLHSQEKRLIRRRLERADVGRNSDIIATRTLMSEILRISSKNQAVGERVLTFTISKSAAARAAENETFLITAGYSENNPYFLYFDPKDQSGTHYGPHFVSEGGAFTNFKSGPL